MLVWNRGWLDSNVSLVISFCFIFRFFLPFGQGRRVHMYLAFGQGYPHCLKCKYHFAYVIPYIILVAYIAFLKWHYTGLISCMLGSFHIKTFAIIWLVFLNALIQCSSLVKGTIWLSKLIFLRLLIPCVGILS